MAFQNIWPPAKQVKKAVGNLSLVRALKPCCALMYLAEAHQWVQHLYGQANQQQTKFITQHLNGLVQWSQVERYGYADAAVRDRFFACCKMPLQSAGNSAQQYVIYRTSQGFRAD